MPIYNFEIFVDIVHPETNKLIVTSYIVPAPSISSAREQACVKLSKLYPGHTLYIWDIIDHRLIVQ